MPKTGAPSSIDLGLRKSERRKIREAAEAGNERALQVQQYVAEALSFAPGTRPRTARVRAARRAARLLLEDL